MIWFLVDDVTVIVTSVNHPVIIIEQRRGRFDNSLGTFVLMLYTTTSASNFGTYLIFITVQNLFCS